MNTYEEIPYPSYCYRLSSPENTSAVASLFGITTAKIDTARILEIGCASGGNLLPMAARYPGASFVGIDLSNTQIDMAKNAATKLNIKNVEFKDLSILDIDLKGKEFDFIIAHGVYSWVSDTVQNRILEICAENLAHNGVAYVSYNTLPGWNVVKTIRDMMLYHGQYFNDPAERVLEARRMLKFAADNIQEATGPYKQMLDREINYLEKVNDNYLLHDHLEAVNEPCYFHTFMENASKHGLSYLGESHLTSMYLGNQTKEAEEILKGTNDIIRQEQYMDFLSNRRFRTSLLVKNSTQVERELLPKYLDGLYLQPKFGLKEPLADKDVLDIDTLDLVSSVNSDVTAKITGKYICQCYIALLKSSPVQLTNKEMVDRAHKNNKESKIEDIRAQWDSIVLQLVFRGIITIAAEKPNMVSSISEKPCVFDVARFQGLDANVVPTLFHDSVKLSDDQRLILQYVNGKNTLDQIISSVKHHIDQGELTLSADGKLLDKGSKDLDAHLPQYINAQLNYFAINALLVS